MRRIPQALVLVATAAEAPMPTTSQAAMKPGAKHSRDCAWDSQATSGPTAPLSDPQKSTYLESRSHAYRNGEVRAWPSGLFLHRCLHHMAPTGQATGCKSFIAWSPQWGGGTTWVAEQRTCPAGAKPQLQHGAPTLCVRPASVSPAPAQC